MNTLTMRRRWLTARPWLKDFAILLGFAVSGGIILWGLGELADVASLHGWFL